MSSSAHTAWLWNGGAFAACDSVPILDRGFRYGMAVFESLPIVRGTPLFLAEHYGRLRQACSQSGLKTSLPGLDETETLLRSVAFDGFARIYATAGDGDVSASMENGRVFVFVEPRRIPAIREDDAYRLTRHPGIHAPMFGGLKTANYWMNISAVQEARTGKFNEALLFDGKDQLISACMANVFVVSGGKIKTPPPTIGARAGVIREWVMRRREVGECRITADDIADADEIFLTSSGLGVMPVLNFEGRTLPSRKMGAELRVEYAKKINEITGGGQTL